MISAALVLCKLVSMLVLEEEYSRFRFTIQLVSIYNGHQYVINVFLFKDPKTNDWWLSYGKDNTPLGYWPSKQFSSMKDKGDRSLAGGFVRGPTVKSNQPQRGSGHFLLQKDTKGLRL